MGSPGIDQWVKNAPQSWAKLAKDASKKNSFEEFKKKFFEGAELENKGYLSKYLTEEQLQHIYTQGLGGEQKIIHESPTPIKPDKPVKIEVIRYNKPYNRSVGSKWDPNMDFSLKLASQSKPKSDDYYKFRQQIMDFTGKSEQAVTKKIQRTRKELKA